MQKPLRNYIVIIIVAVLVLLTACGHHETSIESKKNKKEVKVEVAKPQLNQYTEPFTISGSIKSHQRAILSSKITGHIVDMQMEEGAEIKPGEVLAKIDDSESKLKIADVQAEQALLKAEEENIKGELEELQNQVKMIFHDQEKYLSRAEMIQAQFERIKKLFDKEVATQQEFDQAKTALDEANADVNKSQAEYNVLIARKKQLDAKAMALAARMEKNQVAGADAMVQDMYTKIISPLKGIIVKRQANIGDVVMPGQPIFTVENPEALYLEVNVEEAQAFTFKPETILQVQIDAHNEQIYGKVREVIKAADPDSHTMRVKIDLPPHDLIRSGMYARIIVPTGGKNLFIPGTAIVKKGQVTGVFVVDSDNYARFRIVKVGQNIQGFTEVISGLDKKDKVIISNLEKVSDGQKVVVLGDV